jgi:ABC-type phosphate transport system substrate-binding protein
MRFRRSRKRRWALMAATAVAVGLLTVGATGAYAKSGPPSTQCSGANIIGQGASVMKIAYQNVFSPDFNTSANAAACSGTQGTGGKPTATYTSTSSGLGLESWGVGGKPASFGPTNAFVVTEEPPSETAKAEIEANESPAGSAADSLLTIPVLQESIAVLVHLPANCAATSTTFPGRLVIGNETLQKIFLGTVNNWTEIKDGGDQLTGTGCSAPITRVVRLDPAGSTHILKKYLNLINETAFPTEDSTTQTWNEVSEGTGNIVWPAAAAVVRPAKTGDAAEVAKVAETAGSIGYASLANARANSAFVPPAGGKEEPTFWAPIQNDGISTTKQTFEDPSTDAETATTATANCAKEKFTNGKGSKFPPSSTQDSWAPVTTETKEKNYTLCGIAYELSLTKFSAYPSTTSGEELTVSNFLNFLLETKTGGGQLLIENHDYEALPKKIDKESLAGVKLIAF